jgi:hypothetical protein
MDNAIKTGLYMCINPGHTGVLNKITLLGQIQNATKILLQYRYYMTGYHNKIWLLLSILKSARNAERLINCLRSVIVFARHQDNKKAT